MIPFQGRFCAQTVGFCFLVLVATASGAWAADRPLKVFILAGQSNMQGHANASTFDDMANDPKTAPLLKDLRQGRPSDGLRQGVDHVGRVPRQRLRRPE